MPACMTTSIWPSAAIARTVASGRTYDHDVFCSAAGAAIAAITTSAPVASQTGRKRAADDGACDERSTGCGQRTDPFGERRR